MFVYMYICMPMHAMATFSRSDDNFWECTLSIQVGPRD